jgi:hypothetical protein
MTRATAAILLMICAVLIQPPLHASDSFIPEGKRFRADSELSEQRFGEGSFAWSRVDEQGEINGVRYVIHHAYGTGSIGHWDVDCGIDQIDRYRWCELKHFRIRIYQNTRGKFAVTVGSNHYPRSLVHLRLESGKIFRAAEPGWSGAPARQIASSMSGENSVTTRYWEWPYRADNDDTHGTLGLPLALQYLDFVVGEPKTSKK